MLYRKYRPKSFKDIKGQDIIIKILKNFLRNINDIPQGYLFAGQRGTGKTSTARIFAKALNCLNLDSEYEPCNKCINCESFNNFQFLDLIELDGASNRGIDEIRNLKEHIGFRPMQGKFKVFIIDEAHMLTEPAWNALLKTLEEPPKHAIFILVTTEPEKIPLTILSRVQRFDFRRIPLKSIVEKLKMICENENIEADEKALSLIAEESDGALRDAETLLEKIVLSLNPSRKVDVEYVENFLGKVSQFKILDFLKNLFDKKLEDCIRFINEIYTEGFDLLIFNKEVIKILRNILMVKTVPYWKNYLQKDYSEEFVEKILNLSKDVNIEEIQRAIKLFLDSEISFKKDPPIPTLPLEISIAEFIL
ncbi:MAG: DNA polymerase III subunit gamma/tau [Minisyncoccia bacterium]